MLEELLDVGREFSSCNLLRYFLVSCKINNIELPETEWSKSFRKVYLTIVSIDPFYIIATLKKISIIHFIPLHHPVVTFSSVKTSTEPKHFMLSLILPPSHLHKSIWPGKGYFSDIFNHPTKLKYIEMKI